MSDNAVCLIHITITCHNKNVIIVLSKSAMMLSFLGI